MNVIEHNYPVRSGAMGTRHTGRRRAVKGKTARWLKPHSSH
jgi:hypothetical protein